MTGRRWFWVAVAVQILVLFGIIGSHLYTVSTGVRVKLKTGSARGYDLLRGQTIHLNYEIARIDPARVPVQGNPSKRGETVWVTLAPGADGFAEAVAVNTRRTSVQAGQVALKGAVQWVNPGPPEPVAPPPEKTPPPGPPNQAEDKPIPIGQIQISYGIEEIVLPDNQWGMGPHPMADLTVEIAVDRFGRAALTRVYVNGREVPWR